MDCPSYLLTVERAALLSFYFVFLAFVAAGKMLQLGSALKDAIQKRTHIVVSNRKRWTQISRHQCSVRGASILKFA